MYSTQATKHMDAYNKHDKTGGHGTLMANWWEENELNKANGQGRTTTMVHMQKTHEMLFPNSAQNFIELPHVVSRDNTQARILGQLSNKRFHSENKEYGTGKNKALDLARIGQRSILRDQKVTLYFMIDSPL